MPSDLYPIGDVARRTGIPVSAIRFYSDEGLVRPTGLNDAGHRLYDLHAIARLELIRTLRELDAGLDHIRRLLDGRTTLPDLLAEHLAVVERQERDLRVRRAVLRALIKQDAPAGRAVLMHKLVTMPDEERERLIDDFWTAVGAEMPAHFVDRLRGLRPRLPDDPDAAQLTAWIELADLLRRPDFREDVRTYLRETYGTDPGRRLTAAPVQEFIHETGRRMMAEIFAAHRAGVPADSRHARELVTRLADAAAAVAGVPSTPEHRERLAAGYLLIDEQYDDVRADPQYDTSHGRYVSLVSVINGTSEETGMPDGLAAWLAAALRHPAEG